VLSANKVRDKFSFAGEVDGTDGARDLASGARRRRVDAGTVQLRLVTYQRFASREALHADGTHECRVGRLQNTDDHQHCFIELHCLHRRSQDFVWGCTFLPKKVDDLFLVVAL